jgi:hypothetical protein
MSDPLPPRPSACDVTGPEIFVVVKLAPSFTPMHQVLTAIPEWAAILLYCGFGAVIVYTLTFGLGPPVTTSAKPTRTPNGALVLRESYWPIGVAKFSLLFVGLGFNWFVRDAPGGNWPWWLSWPFYVIGLSGFAQLFFRRRHSFFWQEQRVVVDGFSIVRGRFQRTYSYPKIQCCVARRRLGYGNRFCVISNYPDLAVVFYHSADRARAEAERHHLIATLALPAAFEEPQLASAARRPNVPHRSESKP